MPSAILKLTIPPWLHSARETQNTTSAEQFPKGSVQANLHLTSTSAAHASRFGSVGLRWSPEEQARAVEAEQEQPPRAEAKVQVAPFSHVHQASPTRPGSPHHEHPVTSPWRSALLPMLYYRGRSRKKKKPKLGINKPPSSVDQREFWHNEQEFWYFL